MHYLAPLALALGAVALAGPAHADEATASDKAASDKKDTDKKKPKKICRSVRATGSNLSKRQCRTVEQWQAEDERNNGAELDVINDGARTDYVAPMSSGG